MDGAAPEQGDNGGGLRLKDVPDIAIEVALTSGGIEKLPVYAGLEVREVCFCEEDAFHLHALHADRYGPAIESEMLPGLDLAAIASFMRREDQHEAVRAPNKTSRRQAAEGRHIASLLLVALLKEGSSSRLALHLPSAAWLGPVLFGALKAFRDWLRGDGWAERRSSLGIERGREHAG